MARRRFDMNRKLTGGAACLFLILGVTCYGLGLKHSVVTAGLIRNGLLLGALWIALPTNTRPAAWEDISGSSVILVSLVAMGFLAARFKWMAIPIVLAVAIAIYFMLRFKKRS